MYPLCKVHNNKKKIILLIFSDIIFLDKILCVLGKGLQPFRSVSGLGRQSVSSSISSVLRASA